MSFRIFEQPKEDSSENISEQDASIFLNMFLILSLLMHLLLHITSELFSSIAIVRNLLKIRVLFCVDRELVDITGEIGTIYWEIGL